MGGSPSQVSYLSLGDSGRIRAVCAWPGGVVRLPAEAAAHFPGPRVAWPHLSGPQRSRDTFSQVRAGALGQGKLEMLQVHTYKAGLAQPATVRNSAVIQNGVFKDF